MTCIRQLPMMAICLAMAVMATNAQAASSSWIQATGGSWTNDANWDSSIVADGADFTATFSQDIAADSTVDLDGARTIGHLVFEDATTPSHNWVLNVGTGGPLTLSAPTIGGPSIEVVNQTATIGNALGSGNTGLVIAGNEGYTKAGNGILVVTSSNTYSGDTNITAGILRVDTADNAVGSPLGAATGINPNAAVVSSGATLAVTPNTRFEQKRIRLSGAGVGGTLGALYVDATGTTNGTRVSNTAPSTTPFIFIDADATIRVDGDGSAVGSATTLIGRTTLQGNVLTKTGTGQLVFDPGNGNAGDPVVTGGGGTLHIQQGVVRGGANHVIGINTNVIVENGAQLRAGNVNTYSGFNLTVNPGGIVDLNARGNGNPSSDVTNANQNFATISGNGTITSGQFGNVPATTNRMRVTSATTNSVFGGTITQAAGSNTSLTKEGAGTTLTLTGNSTYLGDTTVTAGILLVNGSHVGGAAYSVASGGTLGGDGSIQTNNANITVLGSLSPGASAGTLNVDLGTGVFDVSAPVTGGLLFELGSIATSDMVVLDSGTLNVGTLNFADFTFSTLAGFSPGIYTLFDAASPINGSIGIADGLIGGLTATLSIDALGNDVLLTVVPEPTAIALAIMAALLTFVRLRPMESTS